MAPLFVLGKCNQFLNGFVFKLTNLPRRSWNFVDKRENIIKKHSKIDCLRRK